MNFKKIELCDKDKLLPFLKTAKELTCEVSFINLLIWQSLYNNCYCIEDGILFLRSYDENKETFSIPFGNIEVGMQKIINHCGGMPVIWAQQGERLEKFKNLYGDFYEIFDSQRAVSTSIPYILLRLPPHIQQWPCRCVSFPVSEKISFVCSLIYTQRAHKRYYLF